MAVEWGPGGPAPPPFSSRGLCRLSPLPSGLPPSGLLPHRPGAGLGPGLRLRRWSTSDRAGWPPSAMAPAGCQQRATCPPPCPCSHGRRCALILLIGCTSSDPTPHPTPVQVACPWLYGEADSCHCQLCGPARCQLCGPACCQLPNPTHQFGPTPPPPLPTLPTPTLPHPTPPHRRASTWCRRSRARPPTSRTARCRRW